MKSNAGVNEIESKVLICRMCPVAIKGKKEKKKRTKYENRYRYRNVIINT